MRNCKHILLSAKSKWTLCLIQIVFISFLSAQNLDSLKKNISVSDNKDLTFTGTKITPEADYDTTGKLIFGGYISAYYAYYTDTAGQNNYQKFPTVSPQSNSFGLNIAQLSAKYSSNRFRGNFTLHYGDIPSSAWSNQFNFIQEANVAAKLANKLWLEAGFFRTHIGLESIQPRENITSSFAVCSYFEPYSLSGAKLTYGISKTFTCQINAFNSFNGFSENNKNKVVGLSLIYEPNKRLSITLNSLTSDEYLNTSTSHQRIYTNLYALYKRDKLSMGAELNYGTQQNSDLIYSSRMAYMYSGLLSLKYKLTKYFSIFGRFEFFNDDNGILTGPIINSNNELIGLNILGYTVGSEIKLIPNSYLRVEYRYLETKKNQDIFYFNNKSLSKRNEAQTTLGVWF